MQLMTASMTNSAKNDDRATKPPTVGPTSHAMLPTTRSMPKPSCRCSFGRMSAIIAACAGPPTSENSPTSAAAGNSHANRLTDPSVSALEALATRPKRISFLTAQPIGQPAADHRPDDARKRQQPEQDAGLGHADAEFLVMYRAKNGKTMRAADLVDEVDDDHDPEPARELVVDLSEADHLLKIIAVQGRSMP